ncbi:MAG: nucleotidyltransferase substrate binding protein [Proteobacteria bacterium]|nr:nucleotidyltransferase substrate binding protein [Pseudomonadota bacterium]
MDKYEKILTLRGRQLNKALDRLAYSYEKVKKLPLTIEAFDDETLETWESFSARFSRASDIFLSQYLRTYILTTDKGFQGTMRDFLNVAEKLGLIDDARAWMHIRELRNIAAHEYTEEDLVAVFKRLLLECPRLLSIKEKINAIN